MDVWKNSTGSDGGILHKSSELLVVSDGELNVSWDDSALLVVLGSISCKFENLSGEVLKDSSKINWGTSSDSLGVSSLLEESGDSSNWELIIFSVLSSFFKTLKSAANKLSSIFLPNNSFKKGTLLKFFSKRYNGP